MLEWFLNIDKELFITLNGLGSPYLDTVMTGVSDRYVWIPLYLYLIFRLYHRFGSKFYWSLGLVLLVILCTDQMTANLFKPFFERLRPCKDSSLDGLITTIGQCRGLYGFASGHAANSMGLAFIYFLMERSTFSKILIAWAVVVAYSRVYLGVHYPGDIIAGIILGITISTIVYKLLFSSVRACSNKT